MRLFKRFSIVVLWIFLIFAALYFRLFFPEKEKSLNVFVWGGVLIPEHLVEFEKKTGIKVNLSYYSSNEELLVKMMATDGVGYDLIMPSGYTTRQMIKKELIKPLDHSKIAFWDEFDPRLLDLKFDPKNRYSIPFEWEIYGLGINRAFFANRSFNPSWKSVYDEKVIDYKIAAQNDPVEAVGLAAFYLFGESDKVTPEQFGEIKTLLKKQSTWVEAYSDSRGPYFLASGSAPVAVTTNAYIRKISATCPNLEFFVPKEGTFITVENFSISRASKKDKYIYEFLNFLYNKEFQKDQFNELGFLPVLKIPSEELNVLPYEKKLFEISLEEFSSFQFFQNLVPQQEVRNMWVEVKSF